MIIRPRRATIRPKSVNTIPFPARPSNAEPAPQPAVSTPSVGRILGVDEIAELFHKSPETVKRNLRQRKLHGFKFGRSWFVREADLQCHILDALESERHLRRRKEQI